MRGSASAWGSARTILASERQGRECRSMQRNAMIAGVVLLAGTLAGSASAEQRVERNVVYACTPGWPS